MMVTFFGHSDTPDAIKPLLASTITDLIINHNATNFYVGNNGNFDSMAHQILKDLSEIYPIRYYVVLAYFPNEKNSHSDLSHTILPEGIEKSPRRFAISWRNKWMIEKSDTVITYVTRCVGGAAQFKALAEKKSKHIIELSYQ